MTLCCLDVGTWEIYAHAVGLCMADAPAGKDNDRCVPLLCCTPLLICPGPPKPNICFEAQSAPAAVCPGHSIYADTPHNSALTAQ